MNAVTNGHAPPAPSTAVELGLAFKRAQHLLALRIDAVLHPLDLNAGLWRVLRALGDRPGVSASELARDSFHTPQTLSTLLQRLEDRGLVERVAGRGRVVDNHLTAAGRVAVAQAARQVGEVMTAALAIFDSAELADLTHLTDRLVDALGSPRPRQQPAEDARSDGEPDTRETPSSASIEFGFALKRAQHLMAQRIDEVLRPLELNLGLWAVLREAARLPGASASELARATFHTPQALSGLVRRLEDRGLVKRSDARGRVVDNHLTAPGHETLAQATHRVEEVIGAALTEFSPNERRSLTRMMTSLANTPTHD